MSSLSKSPRESSIEDGAESPIPSTIIAPGTTTTGRSPFTIGSFGPPPHFDVGDADDGNGPIGSMSFALGSNRSLDYAESNSSMPQFSETQRPSASRNNNNNTASKKKPVEPGYNFMFHAFHAPSASSQSTPRPTNTPRTVVSPAQAASSCPTSFEYEGVPEGFLAAEGSTLSASFSMAPSKADTAVATLSSIHLCSTPNNVLVLGDVLGRVEFYEEVRNTATGAAASNRMALRHSHQAFVAELDCLKSVHIQEKVMAARFLTPLRSPNAVSYLAANERNIKLFRLRADHTGSYGSRRATLPAKAFTGRHQCDIQTLSLCADGETFLSSDVLQVFWWHLEAADTTKAACIANIQPPKISDITEVITTASFHPKHGSLFLLATSSGECRVGDLRDPPSRSNRQFDKAVTMTSEAVGVDFEHDEILSSISDASFLGDNWIVTRDYLGLKLWDLRKPSAPVDRCNVMGYAEPYLPSLYATDAIFDDRFSLAVDGDSQTVVTGLYNGCVGVWQPLKSPEHVEYYQGDVLRGNEPRSGTVKESELYHETKGESIEDEDGNVIEEEPLTLTQEDLQSKVLNVAISDGGSRVAFTVNDHFFVFKRK